MTLPRSGFLTGGGGTGGGSGSGDVTAGSNIPDHEIVRGDGGAKGVQGSGITIADGASGTLAGTNSGDVTLAGTPDYITIANQVITRAKLDAADDLNTFTSATLRGLLTDETGGGAAVFADTPTLVTPILGTPTSGTLTNCTAPASIITSGTLVHERGGLEADVSAYAGLVKISGGATSQAVAGTDYGRYEYLQRVVTSTSRVSSLRRYYLAQSLGSVAVTVTADRLYLAAIFATGTLYSLVSWVTAAVGATNLRIGLWGNGSDNLPTGNPLYDSGNISTASTGKKEYVLGTPFAWTPGALYHIGVCYSGAPSVRGNSTTTVAHPGIQMTNYGFDGTDESTILTYYKSIYVAHTFGALPDLTASNFTHYDVTIGLGCGVDA